MDYSDNSHSDYHHNLSDPTISRLRGSQKPWQLPDQHLDWNFRVQCLHLLYSDPTFDYHYHYFSLCLHVWAEHWVPRRDETRPPNEPADSYFTHSIPLSVHSACFLYDLSSLPLRRKIRKHLLLPKYKDNRLCGYPEDSVSSAYYSFLLCADGVLSAKSTYRGLW